MASPRKCNCNLPSCFTCHTRYTLQRHRFKHGKARNPPRELGTQETPEAPPPGLDALDLTANRIFRERGWGE